MSPGDGLSTERPELQRSGRDPGELGGRLEQWLASRLPGDAHPKVEDVRPTSATGMSSETMLFRASWTEEGQVRREDLVARLAPRPEDVPVFFEYDLGRQAEVLRQVAALTSVPVPKVWWYEDDPAAIGSPFFVMSQIEGQVPPDVMPYNFGDSWLYAMPPGQQRALQDATVGILAQLHEIEHPEERFDFLQFEHAGPTPLRRHVAKSRAWYEGAAADGCRSPLVEQGFAWLETHWPDHEGSPVLSWGDARIGNVMFQGTEPVGVFDWEMAGIGPRELDVAWLIWAHRNFEDITAELGMPGMPHFLHRDDVVDTYQRLTGHELADLDFYLAYSAVQFGIVYLRVGRRSVHFGERDMPDDPDELLINRGPLQRIVAGTYWSSVESPSPPQPPAPPT
jgi:aminoglycoside phosphotransferase (APT) family kinase protein